MAVLESRTAVRRGAYLLIEPETGDGCTRAGRLSGVVRTFSLSQTGDGCTRELDGCQAWCVPSH